ncbi:MAG: ABC transporter permease [Dehalococcoidia bacterium]|nr:ABC transporter permease [Dehalococcoidia bacterium]
MLRPLYIAFLDLKRFLLNPGELAFSIALPVLLFALMYGAFGGGDASFHATAHVVDLDGGEYGRELISRLDGMDEISVRERTLEDAKGALERSAILTAVVIPEGFSDALEAGEPTNIVFKQRGYGGETGQIVAAIVSGVALEMGGEAQARRIVHEDLSNQGVAEVEIDTVFDRRLALSRLDPAVSVEVRGLDEAEGANLLNRLMPGVTVMFLMFAVTMGAQTLVEERRIGTLERLMTTRLGINQLFAGKFLAGTLRATLQAVILLALGFSALRVGDASDFAQLIAFSILVAAAVSAVGLVIGAAARTRDQAVWAAVFFTMFMTIFGGTFFAVADGPLAVIARFTINHYAIEAMEAILSSGASLSGEVVGLGVMIGVTVVGLVVARTLFKVSEGGR